MYQYYSKTQSDVCLVCFDPLLKSISFPHLLKRYTLCYDCLQKFEIINMTISFYHYPLRILYRYNDFFRTLLYQYKGLYDYALKDAFLTLYSDELKQQYKKYMIVVAPSSDEDNLVRGFAPIETIALTFSQNVFTGLYKKEKYKQSDLRYEERNKVHDVIGIRDGELLEGKEVLIIDDVLTSGHTLFSCLSLVLKHKPKKIELLVLSTRKQESDLHF